MPACDQSEHVSSAQSAKHFEQRNVVTVNASSINTFSNPHIVVAGFSCFDLEVSSPVAQCENGCKITI